MERVQLRKEGLQEDNFIPGFHVNEKVLASWSDCRFYPAKVLKVNKDASYTVKFYDGVVQTVKGIHVKPFIRERKKKLPDKNTEKPQVKKPKNVRKIQENAAETFLITEEQTDHVPEEEEDGVLDLDGDEPDQKKRRIQSRNTGHKKEQHVENISVKKESEEGERVLEEIGQHNYSKSFLKKDSGHEETVVKIEDNSTVFDSRIYLNEGMVEGSGTEEAKPQTEQKKKEIKAFPHDRKSRRRRVRGKRRLSMARRRCPSKKNKTDTDKNVHTDCKPTPALTNQRAQGNGPEPDPSLLTHLSNGTTMPKSEPKVRKQAFHNPNRFSREPLYREVKNQPPAALSVNLDHNPYNCSTPGCMKSFRKAKLLHYHMKYYHGHHMVDEDLIVNKSNQTDAIDQRMAFSNQNGVKKRCIALSSLHACNKADAQKWSSAPPAVSAQNYQPCSLLKEKTREKLDGNTQRCFNKERERRFVEIAGVKECEKLKEKKSRDFLHIKLKKKKNIRKTTSDEESIPDWSSDSCGWSDDDTGVDLGVISSPLSCSSVASTAGSRENVRCVCEVEEENDFMLQCEDCLYWQHGTCMGLLEEKVPERYTCFICRDSLGQIRGQRSSLQYWNDREWLNNGHMYGLSFLENYSCQNDKKITATHQLLGDVQHVLQVLNGLQLKISVLQSQTHPDLKLWQKPWKLSGRSKMKSTAFSDSKTVSSSAPSEDSLHLLSSFQDYISSEHCYQKPHAVHQVLEPRLVLKTRVNSELEDGLYKAKSLLKNEQHYNGEIQQALHKTCSISNHSKKVGKEHEVGIDGGGVIGGALQQQWKTNLLEHIEAVQEEVTHRMDFIERELDVLENWLDCTGELEPPEPLDRLPELKHSIKQLLNELGKVQQIALVCAT